MAERELAIKFRKEKDHGGHFELGVFIGKLGYTKAKAGTIVIPKDQWDQLPGAVLMISDEDLTDG